jgi:predicted TIM-barrel fold metal-dependent hydrolase
MCSDSTQGDDRDSSQTTDRIDVHAHFLPAFYREALIEAGLSQPDGIRELPAWNVDGAIAAMDRLNIGTAMLSISSPGVDIGHGGRARSLARSLNDEARRLCETYPGRFGSFAIVPLPNVDDAIAEACYALDILQADGVVLETNHDGVYLGDPLLEPLYVELNRRKAVIFIHPTSPACACCARHTDRYPQPAMEFMFETTRSVVDMVLSGVLNRFPDLRVIVPHAGAALPILTERIELLLPVLCRPGLGPAASLREAMGKLHFDLAGAAVPQMLAALLTVASPDRLHYGSDYPFTPADACEALANRLATTTLLDDALRARIWRENALSLFPRLRRLHTHSVPAATGGHSCSEVMRQVT